MNPILDLANKYNLKVIEDVAEAIGARYKGRLVGTFGDIACYSFFANKIMTTGEGGMLLTNDIELNRKLRILRDHGMSQEKRYVHVMRGFNYRMTNMQAAIGIAQLQRLDKTLLLRKKQEEIYLNYLDCIEGLSCRKYRPWCSSVHWLMTVTFDERPYRDYCIQYLKSKNIDSRPMIYPVHDACHFEGRFSDSDYMISSDISKRSLHLPSSLSLSVDQIKKICDLVHESVSEAGVLDG